MRDIFVLLNDVIMRAIQYTNQARKNILSLLYSTCTNDLVICSKQASILEAFVLAFFIEFNRLFIADSPFINALQKNLILKIKVYLNAKKNLYNGILVENRNGIVAFFNTNIKINLSRYL